VSLSPADRRKHHDQSRKNHPHPGCRVLCDLLPIGQAILPARSGTPFCSPSRCRFLLLPQAVAPPVTNPFPGGLFRGSRRWPGICAAAGCLTRRAWCGGSKQRVAFKANSFRLPIIHSTLLQHAPNSTHRCRTRRSRSCASTQPSLPISLTGPVAWAPHARFVTSTITQASVVQGSFACARIQDFGSSPALIRCTPAPVELCPFVVLW